MTGIVSLSLPNPIKGKSFLLSTESSRSTLQSWNSLLHKLRGNGRFLYRFSDNKRQEEDRKELESALSGKKNEFEKLKEIKRLEEPGGGGDGGGGGGWFGKGGWFGWFNEDNFWQEAKRASLAALLVILMYLLFVNGKQASLTALGIALMMASLAALRENIRSLMTWESDNSKKIWGIVIALFAIAALFLFFKIPPFKIVLKLCHES